MDQLQTAETRAGQQVYCRVLIELYRAMSQQQLGQQATESLGKAAERLNASAPKAEDDRRPRSNLSRCGALANGQGRT